MNVLHAALLPTIELDDSHFEKDTLETAHMEHNIAGGGDKVPIVMAVRYP